MGLPKKSTRRLRRSIKYRQAHGTWKAIISRIESDRGNRVLDLHAWGVSPHHVALMVSIVPHYPMSPDYYKELISETGKFAHVTIEINECPEPPSIPVDGAAV